MEVPNLLLGRVLWTPVTCGAHGISVEASNSVGADLVNWTLTVTQSYEVL